MELSITNVNDTDLANALKFVMKAAKEQFWPGPFRNRTVIDKVSEGLGHEVANYIRAEDMVDLATKLSSFWDANGLGDMKIVQIEPLLVEIKNCFDCVDRNSGLALAPCTFKKKLINTIFKDVLDYPVDVKEVECCRTHSAACRFKIILSNNDSSG